MFKNLLCATLLLWGTHVFAAPVLTLSLEDNLFVRVAVPAKGIVCSNQGRAERLSNLLTNKTTYSESWGTKVYIGEYQGQPMFIAAAPVGSGSGLVFSELYAAGASYIIRYGSDDIKSPSKEEAKLIKIVDEADNLYGFELASGIPYEQAGKSIRASSVLIEALDQQAKKNGLDTQKRVCHHLENYHAMRTPGKYAPERRVLIEKNKKDIHRSDKKESIDMETAVLFRVAKDFDKHAATVLQTVNKENKNLSAYEGANKAQALEMESVFGAFVLSTLHSLPNG